jgi:NADPH:quinone reductase-like Zn-dependent oxidoreductase
LFLFEALSDDGAATLPLSFLAALSALTDGCDISAVNAARMSVFVSDGTSPAGCVALQVGATRSK